MPRISHIVFLALILVSATVFAAKYNAVIDIGDPMPAFDELPGIDGKTLSSNELDANIVVLVSLANHCPWVQGMDAGLVELANHFKGQDVDIIGFSVNRREDDRLPAMIEHAEKNNYNFPYIYDESQELGRKLGATRTPEYFVFDRNRQLVYMGLLTNSPAKKSWSGKISFINGEPSEFYTRDAIQAALDGKQVAVSETRAHGCSVKYEN